MTRKVSFISIPDTRDLTWNWERNLLNIFDQKLVRELSSVYRYTPSRGSIFLGLRLFQNWLWCVATWNTVSVASTDATSGSSGGGASPRRILATARADLEMASKLYPPYIGTAVCVRNKGDKMLQLYLEGNDQFAICQTGKHMRHMSVSRGRDFAFSKIISLCGIKSCGDYRGN